MMARLDEESLEEVARYFAALSVGVRLRILNALRTGERNVGELTELAGTTQANVSKHLAVLLAGGLVEKTPRGTNAFYRIADPRIYQLCDVVCGQIGKHFRAESRRKRTFLAMR